MKLLSAGVVALLCTGCFVPRSAVFGQSASVLAAGRAEASVSTGLVYQSMSFSQSAGSASATSTNSGVTFPAVEGNAALGLTDMLGVNLHLSPAGLQPGVKVSLLRGDLSLAVMPELAVGYVSMNSGSTSGSTTTTTASNAVGILVGFKFLASHSSGVYGGLGYDYQSYGGTYPQVSGLTQTGGTQVNSASHNLAFAVGYEVELGALHIRPELAVMFSPAVSNSTTYQSTTTTQGGGSQLYFFPNVSFAVAGSKDAATPAPVAPAP